MTLDADEFIRRFLLPVLPQGLQRIRYYGLLQAQYLDPEEHLLPYWGEQQQVRKGKDGLKNWT
jgi:hypothetical protein